MICLTSLQLRSFDSIILHFQVASNPKITFLHPNDEIFLMVDIWPQIPPAVRLKGNFKEVDVVVRKVIHKFKKEGHCHLTNDYTYSGRIAPKRGTSFIVYMVIIFKILHLTVL